MNARINFISSLWKEIRKTKFSNTKICTNFVSHSLQEAMSYFLGNNSLDSEITEAVHREVKIITFWDDDYPVLLKTISDPPLILFVKGELNKNDNISIVGSRKLSSYGSRHAYKFSKLISQRKINVVSGMAAGVDAFAHKAAIENSISSPGIAVLGSGLNHTYPSHNKDLYQGLLARGGAIISEFGLELKPRDYFFPRRNRIISALSRATIVIEARARSGSLITARLANEQGRDVLALPGPIDAQGSAGTNKLISNGARMICSEQDLLEYLELNEIGDCFVSEEIEIEDSEILDKLNSSSYTVQSLSEELSLPVKSLYKEVLALELKGKIQIKINGAIEVL